MKLVTTQNLPDVDGVYEKLIELHEGRSEDDSMRVNARLILLLINHIGDREVALEAMHLAGATCRGEAKS